MENNDTLFLILKEDIDTRAVIFCRLNSSLYFLLNVFNPDKPKFVVREFLDNKLLLHV